MIKGKQGAVIGLKNPITRKHDAVIGLKNPIPRKHGAVVGLKNPITGKFAKRNLYNLNPEP
jgi:hypothetical protein